VLQSCGNVEAEFMLSKVEEVRRRVDSLCKGSARRDAGEVTHVNSDVGLGSEGVR